MSIYDGSVPIPLTEEEKLKQKVKREQRKLRNKQIDEQNRKELIIISLFWISIVFFIIWLHIK